MLVGFEATRFLSATGVGICDRGRERHVPPALQSHGTLSMTYPFSECAVSLEKRTASEPNTAPQAVCVGDHVGSEVQPRRPPCCRFMSRLSVNDPSQSTVEVSAIFSITSSVATKIALPLRAARLFKKLAKHSCKTVRKFYWFAPTPS